MFHEDRQSPFVRRLLLWWPIRRSDQAIFAEAFGEAIHAGIEITAAITLAARVQPNWRFRNALTWMRRLTCEGQPLEVSLVNSGARVDPRLLAALQVGEAHGCLAEELFAFARDICSGATERLRQAVGRRPEATRFAAALARLLRERGLTLDVVESAGRIASAGSTAFAAIVRAIIVDMENATPFVNALRRHPIYFDLLYCDLLEAAKSRPQVRDCLERLGQSGQAA
jgi:type II secretory pathway component PulF